MLHLSVLYKDKYSTLEILLIGRDEAVLHGKLNGLDAKQHCHSCLCSNQASLNNRHSCNTQALVHSNRRIKTNTHNQQNSAI